MAAPLTDPDRPTGRPGLALALAAGFAAVAAFVPLVPPELRGWGFAAFGAVGLFAAARGGRFGLPAALLLVFVSKLAFDLMNYAQHGYDSAWLPLWPVYACLAVYALAGWTLCRTGNLLRIAGGTFAASLAFFLATNFGDWVGKSLPYENTLGGLLEAYAVGLPFWRGTLIGDFVFTAALFGLHFALTRVPVGRPVAVPVDASARS